MYFLLLYQNFFEKMYFFVLENSNGRFPFITIFFWYQERNFVLLTIFLRLDSLLFLIFSFLAEFHQLMINIIYKISAIIINIYVYCNSIFQIKNNFTLEITKKLVNFFYSMNLQLVSALLKYSAIFSTILHNFQKFSENFHYFSIFLRLFN